MQIIEIPKPSFPKSREYSFSDTEFGWVLFNLRNILYQPEVNNRTAALRRRNAMPVLVEPRIKDSLAEQVIANPKGANCIKTARVVHPDDMQPYNVLDHHVSSLPMDYLPDSASAKKLIDAIATGLTCCSTLTLQQIIDGMALPGPFIPANGVDVDLDQLLPYLLWEAQENRCARTDQLNIAQFLLPLLLAEEFSSYRFESEIPKPIEPERLDEPLFFNNSEINKACGGPIMILTTEKYSTRDYIDADGEHQLALYLRYLIQQKGIKSAVVIIIQRAKKKADGDSKRGCRITCSFTGQWEAKSQGFDAILSASDALPKIVLWIIDQIIKTGYQVKIAKGLRNGLVNLDVLIPPNQRATMSAGIRVRDLLIKKLSESANLINPKP